jgi:hypothetical protein
MIYSFAQKRSVELELKLNSSTKVDGEIRQATLAQNPMLPAALFYEAQSSHFLMYFHLSFCLIKKWMSPLPQNSPHENEV